MNGYDFAKWMVSDHPMMCVVGSVVLAAIVDSISEAIWKRRA